MEQTATIQINEDNVTNNTASAIKKWIRLDPKLRKSKIEPPKTKTRKKDMGIDPSWLTEIILSSVVIAELIRCIRSWKEASGSKVVIIIKSDDGKEYKIDDGKD